MVYGDETWLLSLLQKTLQIHQGLFAQQAFGLPRQTGIEPYDLPATVFGYGNCIYRTAGKYLGESPCFIVIAWQSKYRDTKGV